jgi:hypothetical protein
MYGKRLALTLSVFSILAACMVAFGPDCLEGSPGNVEITCDHGTVVDASTGQEYLGGAFPGKLALRCMPDAGFEFVGWSVEGTAQITQDGDTIAVSSAEGAVRITAECRNYSSSTSLTPVVDENDVLMPGEEMFMNWSFKSADLYMSGGTWLGMPSTPLIVGDVVYVRAGSYLYALDIDSGTVLHAVKSEGFGVDFYHYVSYGNGVIFDTTGYKAYDLELNYLYDIPKNLRFVTYHDGYFYGCTTSSVHNNVTYYSMFKTSLDVDSDLVNGVKTNLFEGRDEFPLFSQWGQYSAFIIRDGWAFFLEGDREARTVDGYRGITAFNIETEEHVTLDLTPMIGGMSWDDGWLTYDDGYLYLTAYIAGLFNGVGPGFENRNDAVCWVKFDFEKGCFEAPHCKDIESPSHEKFKGITSGFVVKDGHGYINARALGTETQDGVDNTGTRMISFDIGEDGEPIPVGSAASLMSHGGIVLNTAFGDVRYVYLIPYNAKEQGVYIFTDRLAGGKWTLDEEPYRAMSDPARQTFCSQGVRIGPDAQFVYYVDSGYLDCYIPVDRFRLTAIMAEDDNATAQVGYGGNAKKILSEMYPGSFISGNRMVIDGKTYTFLGLNEVTLAWEKIADIEKSTYSGKTRSTRAITEAYYRYVMLVADGSEAHTDNRSNTGDMGWYVLSGGEYQKRAVYLSETWDEVVGKGAVYSTTKPSAPAGVFTISFDSNGGSAVPSITQAAGSPVSAPSPPTREGYSFSGWDPSLPSSMPVQDMTIVARWTVNSYTITFDPNGGSAVPSITQAYGTAVKAPADPVREGYSFSGWSPALPSAMPAKDLSVRATWTKLAPRLSTISFDSNGGSAVPSITQEAGSPVKAPADPVREGYSFSGWSPALPATMPDRDVTVTAVWTVNSYTISFDSNGGSAVPSITQAYGTAVSAPSDPIREGHTFAGWEPSLPATMPAMDLLLKASWEKLAPKVFTITFDSAGGSPVQSISLEVGATIRAPSEPVRTGYTFSGWEPSLPQTMPDRDVKVVAKWDVNSYTITFDSAGGSQVPSMKLDYGSPVAAPSSPVREGYAFSGWSPSLPATMPAEDLLLTARWTAKSFTIAFDSAGGTAVPSITQTYGSPVSAPPDPTREGHTFAGWEPAIPATMPDHDVTVTAGWSVNNYTISFDSKGGSPVSGITQAYGTPIRAPSNPTREGYAFAGWEPSLPATMPAGDLRLAAIWEARSYTITFDPDGGSAVPSITQAYGSAVEAPSDPVREGYSFAGWEPSVPSTMPANDVVVVAQWTANSYTISFDSNGGSPVPSITQKYGAAVEAPSDPVREGHSFAGWEPSVPSTMPAGDLSVVARWTVNTYTIAFDPAGGSAVPSIVQKYGAAVEAPSDPVREGHSFAGWEPSVPSTMPAGDLRVVARWTVNTYTISFDSAGGSEVKSITQAYGSDVKAPADPAREGYAFAGWEPSVPSTMPAGDLRVKAVWARLAPRMSTISFDPNGGSSVGSIIQEAGTTVSVPAEPTRVGHTFAGWEPSVPSTMPAGDLRVVARWTVNTYTISFDSYGGSEVKSITQAYGTDVKAPSDPVREGHSFAGWEPSLPATMPAGDISVTARWAVNTYTISFDSAGGSHVSGIAQAYGTPIRAPSDPTREGYTFAGWEPSVPSTMPAGDLRVVALWTANTYTITFDSDGGSEVHSIALDFGAGVVAPADPVKDGYIFVRWVPELPTTMPARDVEVKALWTKLAPRMSIISFDSTGGSPVSGITQEAGSPVAAPPDPVKEGHTFAGWDPAVPAEMPAENVILKAKWSVNSYTITFDPDGGSEVPSIILDYGADVGAPSDPVKDGYRFRGWEPSLPRTMPAMNVTAVAVWEAESYTISFDTDGGSEVPSIVLEYGASVEVPADPLRNGYSFVRWVPELPATMPARDMEVKAIWTKMAPRTSTISFDSNGGNLVSSITQEVGSPVVAPPEPTKTGYTFAGWVPELPSEMPAGNVTVKATWRANSYTIHFDTDGGSAVPSITREYGSPVVAPPEPTRTGYTFAGWEPSLPATMPARDLTLAAAWIRTAPSIHTITFDPAGGSAVPSITKETGSAVAAPPSPVKVGHTFAGWDPALPSVMPDRNVTLVARWAVNSYTITFNPAGGSAVPSITQDYGTAVEAPMDPVREGYTFAGWEPSLPATMPASNMTLVARWDESASLDGLPGKITVAYTSIETVSLPSGASFRIADASVASASMDGAFLAVTGLVEGSTDITVSLGGSERTVAVEVVPLTFVNDKGNTERHSCRSSPDGSGGSVVTIEDTETGASEYLSTRTVMEKDASGRMVRETVSAMEMIDRDFENLDEKGEPMSRNSESFMERNAEGNIVASTAKMRLYSSSRSGDGVISSTEIVSESDALSGRNVVTTTSLTSYASFEESRVKVDTYVGDRLESSEASMSVEPKVDGLSIDIDGKSATVALTGDEPMDIGQLVGVLADIDGVLDVTVESHVPISGDAFKHIADAGGTLVLHSGGSWISVGEEALRSMAGDGELEFSVSEAKDLKARQKEAAEGAKAFTMALSYGGSEVRDLGRFSAAIACDVDVQEGKELKVWRIDGYGKKTYAEGVSYSDGLVSFESDHLPLFAVGYGTEEEPEPQGPSSGGGDLTVPLAVGAAIAIAAVLAALMLIRSRRGRSGG